MHGPVEKPWASTCQARSVERAGAGRHGAGAMTCAGDNTVAALIAGGLDDTAARRLEHHLDACAACRRLVADLGRGLSALDPGRLPRPGELVGRYTIRRAIGAGGMGVVYEAHDAVLDRRVAIKLVRPDASDPRGLLVEARALARLSHRNVVAIHDAGTANDRVYLCMEHVAGTTLRDWLDEAPRSPREIVATFAAAGDGLAYVHGEGLVHLDFKPANVLVERGGRVVVTDFGIAAMIGRGSAIGGTPRYMAPEQRRGEPVDARADQYAFCTALGDALGGAAPGWARRVIDRGRRDHPADRFASMAELVATLARGSRRLRRRITSTVAVAVAVVVAAVIARSPHVVTRVIDRPVLQHVVDHVVERVRDGELDGELATPTERPEARARPAAPMTGLSRALATALAADRAHAGGVTFAAGEPAVAESRARARRIRAVRRRQPPRVRPRRAVVPGGDHARGPARVLDVRGGSRLRRARPAADVRRRLAARVPTPAPDLHRPRAAEHPRWVLGVRGIRSRASRDRRACRSWRRSPIAAATAAAIPARATRRARSTARAARTTARTTARTATARVAREAARAGAPARTGAAARAAARAARARGAATACASSARTTRRARRTAARRRARERARRSAVIGCARPARITRRARATVASPAATARACRYGDVPARRRLDRERYCAATCLVYASGGSSSASSVFSVGSISIIQPSPYGSSLTSSGASLSPALTAATRPETARTGR